MYVAKGELVEISVEVKRGGASLQGSNATVTVEMVHPIGFVMNTTSWNTIPLLGSQSFTDSFEWEAFVAHSYLNVSNNELSGGIIIRAHVFNPSDDRNENDMILNGRSGIFLHYHHISSHSSLFQTQKRSIFKTSSEAQGKERSRFH